MWRPADFKQRFNEFSAFGCDGLFGVLYEFGSFKSCHRTKPPTRLNTPWLSNHLQLANQSSLAMAVAEADAWHAVEFGDGTDDKQFGISLTSPATVAS
jgi:hypothetical protein